jgi:carboxymethylenebutenolidase
VPDTTYHPAASRELRAYLAVPRGAGPWPGVVVVMDALGLSDDIKDQADRLAAAGYLAFAPDLYSGRGPKCVIATLQASRSGSGEAYEDIEAARQWLLERADCTGKIGIIGFCMGGGFAVLSAPKYAFDAASVNYGEVPKDAASRLAGACPVVASYGKRDRTMPGRAQRLEDALSANGVPHDVKEYPDAGHSFLNRINTGPLFAPLVKFVGFNYHHPSAEDAWGRILTFFDEHLGAQPASSTST